MLHVEDQTDVATHSVTLNDLVTAFQKMWCQAELWITQALFPQTSRGLQPSLHLQHFKQYTGGVNPRPVSPFQREVAMFVFTFLVDKSNYDMFWMRRGVKQGESRCKISSGFRFVTG